MKSNISLLAEVCTICNVTNDTTRGQIWDSIQKYHIRDNIGYTNLDDAIEAFLNAKRCEEMSPCTISNYQNALNIFNQWSKNKAIGDIDTNEIRAFILYLKEDRNLKKTSIQQYTAILRSFFNWCEMEHVVQENAMKQIKNLKLDKNAARHPLSAENQQKVIDSLSDLRDKAIYSFFVTTGCRVSEVINIKVKDINWTNRSVIVFGKGSKYRQVFFTRETEGLIKELIKKNQNKEYLFCGERWPYSPLSKNGMEAIVRKIGLKAKLDERLYPHKLRHTFATNCLNEGMDLVVIQKLLGHTTVSTTQVYAELNNATIQEGYEKWAAGASEIGETA